MTRVLVVDDEAGIRRALTLFLERDGYETVAAANVRDAMEIVEATKVDVLVSDIVMPDEDGVQLLAQAHEHDRGIAVILLTGEPNVGTAADAVRHGAFDYLSKPVSKGMFLAVVARAARAKAQHDQNLDLIADNERYRQDLEGLVETRTAQLSDALRGTIGVVTQTLEMRDPYTAGHQRRVASLSRALAVTLDLAEDVQEGIEMAALVHDVGKIAIPAEILAMPRRLTETEFSLIREHPTVGFEILRHVAFPWPIAEIIVQHHERLDGTGYPAALSGDEIRMEARIISVADVVEAMASHRPYRAALGIDAALDEIRRLRGRAFEPRVVDACVHLFKDEGFQLIE